MSLSPRILIGLVAGVAVGVFFDERAAILDWPARAFVRFLGVTVLPYLVTSSGIARGTPEQGRRLLSPAGLTLLEFFNAVVADGHASGLFANRLDYWIKGGGTRTEREPRWSIGGNVLGLWNVK